MKYVFLAGSRKFFKEIEEIKGLLEKEGILVLKGRDSLDDEKAKNMFQRIDQSDIVYVFCKGGYVGETTSAEIEYAFGKGKEIFSSESLTDDNTRKLVSGTMNPKELVGYTKN